MARQIDLLCNRPRGHLRVRRQEHSSTDAAVSSEQKQQQPTPAQRARLALHRPSVLGGDRNRSAPRSPMYFATNRLATHFWWAEMTSRWSSGPMRADRAVEPTRSENITVTWRRSAVSRRDASTAAEVAAALWVVVSTLALARNSLRRWLSRTSSFSRS